MISWNKMIFCSNKEIWEREIYSYEKWFFKEISSSKLINKREKEGEICFIIRK